MKHKSAENVEFVRLLTGEQRRLYCYIIAMLPNPTDVDDVLQATNMVLWSKAGEFAPGTNFGAWARRVAHLEVLAFWRRERGQRLLYDSSLINVMAAEWEEASGCLDARREALGRCVKKLHPKDRDLLTRRYGSGQTAHEIAAQIARPVKSIYRSLERTRMVLLECIRHHLTAGETS
ncbi:MAG: sigma-70 family RNA polymerase sigma factor [Pirellulales bacterium]|nr:sigma-70 family RNA polymerase sigma factor [Pirellulales bacterium]